jgi:hypothetical protein
MEFQVSRAPAFCSAIAEQPAKGQLGREAGERHGKTHILSNYILNHKFRVTPGLRVQARDLSGTNATSS